MDFGLRGRVVLVTGARSGIGRATALRLADHGGRRGLSAGFVTRWQGRDLASLALLEAGAHAVPDAAG